MKTITRHFFHKTLIVLCFFIAGNSYGQTKKPTDKTVFGRTVKTINPKNGKIRCGTVEYEKYLQEKNPQRMSETEFEAWLAPLVQKEKLLRTNSKRAATVITIPVVVHVIHSGQPIGTAPNIVDAQVQSQITVLNQDFRKMLGTPGYNNNPVGADVEIEFVLAKADPNGNPTNGIDRVNMCQAQWSQEQIEDIVKPATIWDPAQYMNMWSTSLSDTSLLGYAQPPDGSGLGGLNDYGGPASTDGVVSSYDVFGSRAFDTNNSFLLVQDYDGGRTMTHEVGHWLGLRHIWGDGGSREQNTKDCNASDYCNDTPQAGWENYDCVTSDSCPAILGNDMIENYMDYTNDACMNIFTQNQKDRMLTIMNNAARRSSLKTSTKGTVIPLFAIDAEIKIEQDYCSALSSNCSTLPAPANRKAIITNRGTSALTSATINYNFDGGTNQAQNWTGSLAQNQSVTVTLLNTNFNGVFTASIASANGTTDQRASNNTNTKTFSPVSYSTTNYIFTLQPDHWGTETTWNIKDGNGVTKYSGGPYTDTNENGPLPALITQNWTLADNQCYTFTILDESSDGICCGEGGNGYYNIKTADGQKTLINGGSFAGKEQLFFSIKTLGTESFTTSLDNIYLYPNPAKNVLNIQIPSNFGLPASYTINNTLGQNISQKEIVKESDLAINTSALRNGIYFITIVKNDQKRVFKFIKE